MGRPFTSRHVIGSPAPASPRDLPVGPALCSGRFRGLASRVQRPAWRAVHKRFPGRLTGVMEVSAFVVPVPASFLGPLAKFNLAAIEYVPCLGHPEAGGGIMVPGHDAEEGSPGLSAIPMAVPDLLHPRTAPTAPRHVAPTQPRATSLSVQVLSVIWALIPVLTFGWGAPFTFTYAAVRLRSKALGVCAGAYGLVAVVTFYFEGSSNDNSWQSNAGAAIALVAGAVATAQAFAIRERLIRPSRPTDKGRSDAALAHATEVLRLREQARHIVSVNPALARELQIGRPDRSRGFDDGGLVDVNHVPLEYLVHVLGIDRSTAEQIVDVRDGVGGFSSVDDVSVTLGLHPHALDEVASRSIFCR